MREWHGFTSYDPRAMGETIDRAMREFSSSIKRIAKGQQPGGSGASLTLAVTPPAESALTSDGVQVTPIGRLARVDLSNPANGAAGVLSGAVPPGMYRMTFVVYPTSVPTTSDLTVAAVFNGIDISYAATALPMVAGPYLYGSTTFATTSTDDIGYEITYTNSLSAEFWFVLEAL